jgi:head-tail adaptor
MAYSAGMLNRKIAFYRRVTAEDGKYGRKSGGEKYELVGTFNAAETFNKGVKSLNLGAVDAYEIVMFRMRYRNGIDRWCLIKYHGRWYEIESFNANYQEDQIQITAHERVNQQVNIVEPTPEPTPTPDPTDEPAVNP